MDDGKKVTLMAIALMLITLGVYELAAGAGYDCVMKPDGSVYCADETGAIHHLRASTFRVTRVRQ